MTSTATSAVLEHPIGARGRFSLRLPAGEVAIRAIEGDVARVRDLGGQALADHFRIEASAGSLSLVAPESGLNLILDLGFLRRGHRARLEVELPSLASVTVESASADVRVDGLQGEGHYRTAAGRLTFVHGGGTIDADAVSGDVDVSAVDDLSLGCRTVSGEVTVNAARLSRLRVTTTSGDVRVRSAFAGEGPFSIETVSGDCELVTPSGLRVEARTVAGSVSSPEERRTESVRGRRSFSVGDGRVPFAFRSISGDLAIRPGGPGSVAPAASSAPAPADGPDDDPAAAARLELLRALERGELSVDEAAARLAALEGQGPR